ncbi:hypothetical protein [Longimicrobium sp.]|uniref:hypothetical protein n=1 Tax=Longimicrobium sp. TaxID=2029185 RepID=UPI002C8C637F|nr:hypothetical protein [Longimicrobium sp.]HSU14623.1 hypothetical protein [Longimicrobium sp.]
MARRNWIAEFTERDVRAALALVGTPDSASAVAAELYALPETEQVHLEWVYDALLLVSCVSDDLARRVIDLFAPADEDGRSRMRVDQAQFGAALRGERPGWTVWEIGDVVRDRRQDCAVTAAFRAETGRRENLIGAFTQPELEMALSQVGDSDAAARLAHEVYSIPPDEQGDYDWTDLSLWLFSLVSREIGERVLTTFGTVSDRAEHIREMQRVFRSLRESGELRERLGAVRFQDLVRLAPTVGSGGVE